MSRFSLFALLGLVALLSIAPLAVIAGGASSAQQVPTTTSTSSISCNATVIDLQTDTNDDASLPQHAGTATILSTPDHLVIFVDSDSPVSTLTAFISSNDLTYTASGNPLLIPYDSFDTPCNSIIDLIVQAELEPASSSSGSEDDNSTSTTVNFIWAQVSNFRLCCSASPVNQSIDGDSTHATQYNDRCANETPAKRFKF